MLRGLLLITCGAAQQSHQFRGDEPEGAVDSLADLNFHRPGKYGAHDYIPPDGEEEEPPPRRHREVHPHGFHSFAEKGHNRKLEVFEQHAQREASNKIEREQIRAYAAILQKAASEDKRLGSSSKFLGWIIDVMMDMAGALLSTKEVVPGDYPFMCKCAPPTMDFETGEMIGPKENKPLCPGDPWAFDCYVTVGDREKMKNIKQEDGSMTVEELDALHKDTSYLTEGLDESLGALAGAGVPIAGFTQLGGTTLDPRERKTKLKTYLAKQAPHTLVEKALTLVETQLGTNAIPQLEYVHVPPNLNKHDVQEVVKENKRRQRGEITRLEELMATPLSTKLTRTIFAVVSFVSKIALFGMGLLGITLVLKKQKKPETRSQRKERKEPGSTQ